jgi:hypothetical protein
MDEKSLVKEFSFGGGQFDRQSPPREKLSAGTPILNLEMTLEEALKLSLALEEGCRKVNRYKMSNKTGKRARVCLALHFGPGRIVVYEGKSKV